MNSKLPSGAQHVQEFLIEQGCEAAVSLLPESTATAVDAATALQTSVNHIGKSIAFETDKGVAIVAVVCGDDRVDPNALKSRLNADYVKRLRAEEVKQRTGYAIGGVSPFGLPPDVKIIIDQRLATFVDCFVAAGHPRAIVRIDVVQLVALTRASVEPIAERG